MATFRETFTAVVEFDPEANMYVGYIPELPGAATQGVTLEELYFNLNEVAELVLEEVFECGQTFKKGRYIGTHKITVEMEK